jgi:molybdopterin-guanine dinucleotide biosynthesis protein A
MAVDLVPPDRSQITAVVLAGGLGRRMSADGQGTNKAMIPFQQQPLIAHVIERITPQVGSVIINADPLDLQWQTFGLPVLADLIADRPGPLAGIHAALAVATTPWVLSVPCDTPRLPTDLVEQMIKTQVARRADRVSVRCGTQSHPVIALLHRSLAEELQRYLSQGGRRIETWLRQGSWAQTTFDDESAFVNLNTMDELRQQEGGR